MSERQGEFAQQYCSAFWLAWRAQTKEFVRVPQVRPLPPGCYKVSRVCIGEYRQWVSAYDTRGMLRREFWDCPAVFGDAVCRQQE